MQSIPDGEVLALIRSLGLRSSMCVPLFVRDRVIGALTLVSAESNRLYGARDLTFATELARRIGVAVDNARLYGEAEQARAAAEAMAADVVEQSRAVEAALLAMRAERDDAAAAARGNRPGEDLTPRERLPLECAADTPARASIGNCSA